MNGGKVPPKKDHGETDPPHTPIAECGVGLTTNSDLAARRLAKRSKYVGGDTFELG